ncbi:negative modulator of initiation of replication [Agarivorans sp. Toyoura001]|uniref:replication initiation negative regulator SeqA n=1 Tax=Agarivorans sp. Toyoura001 TaxID=2283141 RepID=UPI0010DCD23C|nr:replication initiation negative regulator SeqA [Agarivorans sp. Toyoura001]GDY27453.1 negative modulator of initiation of replication [Agarivorans sp. Toyoura001]
MLSTEHDLKVAMKTIEIEEDLYLYIAGQTKHIGESASDILRRLLEVDAFIQESAEPEPVELNSQALDDVPPEQPTQESSVSENFEDVVTTPQDPDVLSYFNFELIGNAGSSTKRFLALLASLYTVNNAMFAKACVIKGSKREYFSQDKDSLLASGKTSKPQAIPDTPYWVITNTNTARKRHILHHVASEMGLQESQIERLCEAI